MKDKESMSSERAALLAWQDMQRKIRIIEWLLPRFHKGLSEPKNYEKLIGRVEE